MRPLFAIVMLCVALTGCSPGGSKTPVVEDAWVRLAVVPGRPAAGYFTMKGGASDDRLLRIESAVVDRIELHEVVTSGTAMSMRKMADVPLPARATVEFAPAGEHAMLFGVDPRITPGTGIPMLFTFDSGATVKVEARTVAAGTEPDDAHH